MLHGGFAAWLVPTIGGDPWLERPPVPMWFICGVYAIAGTPASDTVARFAAVLVAVPIVLLVAGIGRPTLRPRRGPRRRGHLRDDARGLLVLEQPRSRHLPRAHRHRGDRGVRAVGVSANPVPQGKGDVRSPGEGSRPHRLLRPPPPPGCTSSSRFSAPPTSRRAMIFGTAMAAIPVAGYLLWNRSRIQIQRYFWFWGFLIAAAVALAWPAVVIGRHPDILQLWKEHYFGRLNQGYLREPWWYYAAYVPYVILPWTIPALIGLWVTRKAAFAGPGPARFLWCWAILPPAGLLALGRQAPPLPAPVHRAVGHSLRPRREGDLAVPPRARAEVAARPAHPHRRVRRLRGRRARRVRPQAPRRPAGRTGGRRVRAAGGVRRRRSLSCAVPRVALGGVVAVGRRVLRDLDSLPGRSTSKSTATTRSSSARPSRWSPPDEPVFVQWDWIGPLETFWVLYHTQRPGVLIRDPWQAADRAPGREHAFILAPANGRADPVHGRHRRADPREPPHARREGTRPPPRPLQADLPPHDPAAARGLHPPRPPHAVVTVHRVFHNAVKPW